MQTFLLIIGLMIAYGILHSLTASLGFKAWMRRILGDYRYEAVYRLIFNSLSTILLVPILFVVAMRPGNNVWEVDGGLAIVFAIIQLTGVVGLLISVLQIDGMRFLGISQLIAATNGDPLPLPDEPLQLGGVYALVRHPLYLFSLLFLWAMPVMSESMLGFVVGSTLYFVVGSIFEEHKMKIAFGEEYVQYQKRVPWMIPFVKFP